MKRQCFKSVAFNWCQSDFINVETLQEKSQMLSCICPNSLYQGIN